VSGRKKVKPREETVVGAGETEEVLLTAELDMDRADEVRDKMRVLQDRRPGLYELK
jgi:predicted amidohydrolase